MLPSGHAAANAPLASQLRLAPALHVDPTGVSSPGLLFRFKWEEAAGLTGSLRKHFGAYLGHKQHTVSKRTRH